MIKLLVKETNDEITRENMKRLQREITQTQVILKGEWKFFEITFDTAVTNFKYPHKFNFVPIDVIQTSMIDGLTAVIWNFDLFDRTNLDITTADSGTVRAFIGRYSEDGGEL